MALITRYGTTFGLPLIHTGRIFFVAPADNYTVNGNPYDASDDNDGLSPERALRTVARAIVLATASADDLIYLLEGTHTVTATVAVSKAGLTFMGSSEGFGEGMDYQPRTVLTSTGTNDELLSITASNASFLYLTIRGTTGYSAVSFQTTSAVDNTLFYRCLFDLTTPAVNLDTRGVDLAHRRAGTGSDRTSAGTSDISRVRVKECIFESDGAQGPGIEVATGGAFAENCTFLTTGAWATPFLVATDAISTVIKGCSFAAFGATGTYSACIAGNLGTNEARAVYIERCYFPATPGADAIRGFGAAEIQAVDCYYAAATNATTINAISRLLS